MPPHLTPLEQGLKEATRAAIAAAGGQEAAASLPGVRVGQSSLSHYVNTTNPEHAKDFVPLDVAIAIEACGHGQPGHPHLLRAFAQRLGFLLMPRPGGGGVSADCLTEHLATIATESAEAIRSLAACVGQAPAMTRPQHADALRQARDLSAAADHLIARLESDGLQPSRAVKMAAIGGRSSDPG